MGSEAPEKVVIEEGGLEGEMDEERSLLDALAGLTMDASRDHRDESRVQEEGGEMPTHDD